MKHYIAILILLMSLLEACQEYTPKPKGYNRIDIEEGGFMRISFPPFSFNYPQAVQIDTLKSGGKDQIWFNIQYPKYKAVVHCTYLPITKATLPKAIDDSYHLAYSHTIKADGINQQVYTHAKNRVLGILYEIGGDVATPLQFFVTDSVSHFMRGSFYYTGSVNADSIAPVTELIKEDIERMMYSFEWIP